MHLLKARRMTRPNDTTAYASGDLVANSTTAGSVVPLVFGDGPGIVRVRRFLMRTSNSTVTNKNYLLYLFASSPTVTNGDNGAFAVTDANGGSSIFAVFGSTAAMSYGGGSFQMFYPLDAAATAVNGWADQLAPGTFYGLLKANAAYTPTALETYDLAAEIAMDINAT